MWYEVLWTHKNTFPVGRYKVRRKREREGVMRVEFC